MNEPHKARLAVTRPQLLLMLAFCFAMPALGGPAFPGAMSVTDSGSTHRLALTGEAARVFLVFTVYEMAHYQEPAQQEPVQGGGAFRETLAPGDVVTDGPAKAIAIRFTRNLGRDRIRTEFEKTIRRNAKAEWLDRAAPTIDAFLAAIDQDAKADDQVVYYWLEGGRLIAEFNGERFFSVADADFAKLIWSIWFGENPVCDSEALLARGVEIGVEVDN